jgi:hypothetical protein
VSGRHTDLVSTGRRTAALLSGATVLGLWFGLHAPDVTPVAPPAAVVQQQTADDAAVPPAVPQPVAGRPQRAGRR